MFKIFKNPVKMIHLLVDIEAVGKKYQKNSSKELLEEIDTKMELFEKEFHISGVPEAMTSMHTGVVYEMVLRGDPAPPLMALEHALLGAIDKGMFELEELEEEWKKEEDPAAVDNLLGSLDEDKKE